MTLILNVDQDYQKLKQSYLNQTLFPTFNIIIERLVLIA